MATVPDSTQDIFDAFRAAGANKGTRCDISFGPFGRRARGQRLLSAHPSGFSIKFARIRVTFESTVVCRDQCT